MMDLSAKEVCERLKISDRTLRNWRDSEVLVPAYYKKRRPFYREADVIAIEKKLASPKNRSPLSDKVFSVRLPVDKADLLTANVPDKDLTGWLRRVLCEAIDREFSDS